MLLLIIMKENLPKFQFISYPTLFVIHIHSCKKKEQKQKTVQKGSSLPPCEGGRKKHEIEKNELLKRVICIILFDGIEG